MTLKVLKSDHHRCICGIKQEYVLFFEKPEMMEMFGK